MHYRTFSRIFLLLAFITTCCAQSLVLVSGNGQLVSEQFLSNALLVAQALDAQGKPAAGVAVTWAITSGSGTVAFADHTTDANGLATAKFLATNVNPGQSFFPTTVTASTFAGTVSFIVTTTAGLQPGAAAPLVLLVTPPLENRKISGASGSTQAGAVVLKVAAQSGFQLGQGIPNVAVRIINSLDPTSTPPAACNGPNGVLLTDSTGTATCDLKITGQPGTTQITAYVGESQTTPSFSLQITPGIACNYSLSATSQSFGSNGGNGSVSVTATPTCGWNASSNVNWISFTSATSSVGSGSVGYIVASNTGAARTGTLNIAGIAYTVSQTAVGAPNALAIATPPVLPGGVMGTFYTTTLQATGGVPLYAWTLTGTLPPGLSLNAGTGVISGTPTVNGSYVFSATVTDSLGHTTQPQSFSLAIGPTGTSTFTITNVSFPNGLVGQAYQQLLNAIGGCVTPFSPAPSFAVTSGSLPPGTSLQTNSDRSTSIAGTPTVAGVFAFNLTATDACTKTATAGFTITVNGTTVGQVMTVNPATVSFSVLAGALNIPADQTIAVSSTNGSLNYNVAIVVNTGGSWLALKTPVNGTTNGNITVGLQNFSSLTAGNYSSTLTITSSASNSPVVVPVTLTVLSAPTLAVSPLTITVNQFASPNPPIIRQNIQVSSGTSVIHFTASAVTNGGGPWLAVSQNEGNTPASLTAIVSAGGLAPGPYTGAVVVTPTGGVAQSVTVVLNVLPAVNLIASPAPLSFSVSQGSATTQQTLSITSSGAPISFTSQADSSGGWLAITPNGTTPANLTVSVNPAGLAAGGYNGVLTITPTDGSIAPLTIGVNLTVTGPAPVISALTNAASFAPGPVSPGELITIFGTGLGTPATASLQLNSAGNVDTTLAGTMVFFDGFAAPMVYASPGQLSAFVPYEIAGRSTTQIQVQYQGIKSTSSTQRVIDAVPGIFVLDASSGQGAILNQDTTVNSSTNGALPGSIVSIYATGEGLTDPVIADGTIINKIVPKPRLGVTVQIGGQPAVVTYAGSAPGEPAGVLQVNAQIPATLAHGTSAPVVITVGTAASQAGVTVQIR